VVITADQQAIITEQHVRGTPALVVEILSPGTRRVDQQVKRDLYERAGVREYWAIDPVENRVAVHRRREDGRLIVAAHLASRDTLTTPLLPGFATDLGGFFV
jgi:Uma2 family endonuclease